MKQVAILGGLGLTGSKLCERLVGEGYDVEIIDNEQRGKLQNLSMETKLRAHFTHRDLRKGVDLSGAEIVFNLAAHLGGVEYISQNDQRVMLDNMMIDSQAINAALQAKVSKFIFASTACTYNTDKQTSWDSILREGDVFPIQPESGYGYCKLMTEFQLNKINSMEIGIPRFFNIYGPGEDFSPGSHAVPELMRKILFGPETLEVYGSGLQGRCFLYAEDAVDAYMKILDRGCINKPINIGDPHPIRIRDLVELMLAITGKTNKGVHYNKDKPTGVFGRTPDVYLAKKLLGWEPRTSLYEGLAHVRDWMLKQAPAIEV